MQKILSRQHQKMHTQKSVFFCNCLWGEKKFTSPAACGAAAPPAAGGRPAAMCWPAVAARGWPRPPRGRRRKLELPAPLRLPAASAQAQDSPTETFRQLLNSPWTATARRPCRCHGRRRSTHWARPPNGRHPPGTQVNKNTLESLVQRLELNFYQHEKYLKVNFQANVVCLFILTRKLITKNVNSNSPGRLSCQGPGRPWQCRRVQGRGRRAARPASAPRARPAVFSGCR